MQQILNFLIRNKSFILFLSLFFLSLFFIIQSHSYHKSKFFNSTNFLTGGIYKSAHNIGQYFNLVEENQKLLDENNRLKLILFNDKIDKKKLLSQDSVNRIQYEVTDAKVIKNSYVLSNNYLTLDKGYQNNFHEDLGVITSLGIVGIIDKTTKKYSRVLSLLNSNSRVNAQLKKTNHFGPLTWDGLSPKIVQLTDIQGLAKITIGDTVVTSGNSTIFPKGILIGQVTAFELIETEDVYKVQVKLFNDFSNLEHVHVIKNKDRKEILKLNKIDE